MTITGGTALGKDEIDEMVRDAEKFADEDRRRKEAAEARNNADQLSYQVDKALSEYGDKVPAEEREAVQKANEEVKEALKGDDIDRIKKATESLMQAYQRIGQAMYAAQQAQAAAGGGGSGGSGGGAGAGGGEAGGEPSHPSGDGDVVEGEIVDEGSAGG